MENELEKILIKNFNEMMPGVRLNKVTYQQFKKEFPTFYKVIIKSMKEVKK